MSTVWENPQWTDGQPGAFAVVIGVSRYDHLAGGPGPLAAEDFGLRQLAVSALTAYRVFEWLRDHYRRDDVPLARCWLALSPTQEECEQEPELARHSRATYNECETALNAWVTAMRALSPEQAEHSTALFFFSGHGFELYHDELLLLPCDYLDPMRSSPNRALRMVNLRHGLAGLAVPSQHFFVDSCRNDHSRLRELGIALRGNDVLAEHGTAWANSTVNSPVVFATAAGDPAYQPASVRDDDGHEQWTLFGRALLAGVRQPPAEIRTMARGFAQIELCGLVKYMIRRVAERLAEHGTSYRQAVRLGGSFEPPSIVADVAEPATQPAMPTPVETLRRTGGTDVSSGAWRNLNAGELSRRLFADRNLAEHWLSHSLRTLDGQPVRHEPVWVREDQAERGAGVVAVRVPDAGRPMVWRIGAGRRVLTCRLPPLGTDAVLRFELSAPDGECRIAVSVDPGSPGTVGEAARVWQSYEDGDLRGVLPRLGPLLRAVRDGAASSAFPALVATLIRLRVDPSAELDLPGWLVKDAAWPDFRILVAERRLRDGDGAVPVFETPYAVEAFGYAATHARAIVGAADSGPVVAAAEEAVARHQPGGFFCVVAQPGDESRRKV